MEIVILPHRNLLHFGFNYGHVRLIRRNPRRQRSTAIQARVQPHFHSADSLKRHLRWPILMRVPTTTLRPRARYPSTSW